MDTGLLKVFKAVAEEGSISKASKRLCCVQSNVTARIRQLEDELGIQLFYRQPRGVALTPPAKTLLVYADRVLHLLDEAKKAVVDSERARGKLCIGTTETAAAVRLPTVFADFHKRCPDVDLHISTDITNALVAKVRKYTLDLAIVNGPVNDRNIEQMPLFEEELVLGTHPEVESVEAVTKRMLLVSPLGCTYRTRLEQWVQDSGLLPFRIMEFGTLEAILAFVTAGVGMTLLPISVIRKLGYADKIRIHTLPERYSRITTFAVRRSDTIRTKALEVYLDMLMAENQRVSRRLELVSG
jgi:DNA-binding transcriptional LysR family regulator